MIGTDNSIIARPEPAVTGYILQASPLPRLIITGLTAFEEFNKQYIRKFGAALEDDERAGLIYLKHICKKMQSEALNKRHVIAATLMERANTALGYMETEDRDEIRKLFTCPAFSYVYGAAQNIEQSEYFMHQTLQICSRLESRDAIFHRMAVNARIQINRILVKKDEAGHLAENLFAQFSKYLDYRKQAESWMFSAEELNEILETILNEIVKYSIMIPSFSAEFNEFLSAELRDGNWSRVKFNTSLSVDAYLEAKLHHFSFDGEGFCRVFEAALQGAGEARTVLPVIHLFADFKAYHHQEDIAAAFYRLVEPRTPSILRKSSRTFIGA